MDIGTINIFRGWKLPEAINFKVKRWKGYWAVHKDNASVPNQENWGFLPPYEAHLDAFTETENVAANILVPNQWSYTGRKPVISSTLANGLCAYFGIYSILQTLNSILCTSYTLDFQLSSMRTVRSVLESYIALNYDFGTAYAHWRHGIDIYRDEKSLRENDQEMRRNVLVDGRGDVPPRRIWDLYANRVVPWWVAQKYPWGISHAWMEEKERVDVITPINGKEWLVPIPKDANLDLIRIEMLNLGAEYAWLDVLCLRQTRGQRQDLRDKEWKLDVPTIGWVYQKAPKVVCYFNGLGRPLIFQAGYFESDQCWFRRAWTLQETKEDMTIGGEIRDYRFAGTEIQYKFQEQLQLLRKMRSDESVFDILSQMGKRVSTNPVDKVRGLAYLLYTESNPPYDASQSEEDAWTALVDVMQDWLRADLFFLYPEPGDGHKWRPSWKQAMTNQPIHDKSSWIGEVIGMKETGVDSYCGPRIYGYVRGLALYVSNEIDGGMPRQGELIIPYVGAFYTFKIIASHSYPIYRMAGIP
ncbi:hypothetical protein IW262DRAFT_1296809 [Armillaria fumosa]|nr:hypothetical protein IW262DRAFT_1296809 [Armillaria fumosa]